MNLNSQTVHNIEGAVEKFKINALHDIELDLLEAVQSAFIHDKKDLICNGKTSVTIKTLHGRINFKVQRFKNGMQPTEKEQNYFDLTGQFQEIYITP